MAADNFARVLAMSAMSGVAENVVQVTTLPEATLSNVGKIYQYTGGSTENYTNGYFYKNVASTDPVSGTTTYSWIAIDTQPECAKHWVGTRAELMAALAFGDIEDGTIILITDEPDVDNLPTENSTNLVYSGGVYAALLGKEDVFRTITMPQPSQTFNGKVLQFLGTTTNDYIHGFFYECVPTVVSGAVTYVWRNILVQNDKTIQVSTLSPASLSELGNIYEYVGETTSVLTKGFFYQCVEIPNTSPVEYAWECINVQGVDDSLSNVSENAVQNKVVTNALANKVDTVAGKGLSTNDYTTAEKTQLATNTTDIAKLKAEHVELTQAEYDMIGNEKYSDNKEYFIVDASPDDPTYIYGFHIDPDESDSSDCVTYLNDAVGMTPAAMGSTAFNYGSWENVFFMPKPCMLKFDGTVDYYLDPNDYSKKADGITPSDYNNLAYQGNAMMEFPLIWYKYVPGVAEGEGYFYVSNHKVNDTYKCWSNMDCDGNIIEHFYMPIYNGCTYDGKMRSISGLTLAPWSTTVYSASATYAVGDKINYDGKMWQCTTAVETAEAFDPAKWEQFAFNGNTIATEEIAQATANNTTAKTEWYIDTWNDRVLINGLLVLISKSIDAQGTFGRGIDSGSQAAKESYVTGSLDDKGLFYGSTTNGVTAVKVFGMENWWGLVWHRTAGLIGGANNVYLYKMTFSTADGSIVDGYNTSGTGYPSVGGKPTANNYVKKMQFGLFGFLPIEVGSYSTQYYKDYYYDGTGFALVGGSSSHGGAHDGAFCVGLNIGAGNRSWTIGAAPSCKPCLKG